MAYNGFPVGYQPAQIYYPQQTMQAPMQQTMQQPAQQPMNQQMMSPPTIHAEIIQVDGEQMAENHPVTAGTSQMMIARDDSAIYIKTMYANGQYNMDVYTKRPPTPKKPEIDPAMYITRQEFEERISALTESPKPSKKKEKEDVAV